MSANIQPPAISPVVYVTFSAEINPNTTESLLAAFANLVNQGVREVHLLLSTPGGSVMHGLNMYNVLRALPIRLTTHNVGSVNSMGNVVFLAGEIRLACPHSTFMFHGVGFDAPAGVRWKKNSYASGLMVSKVTSGALAPSWRSGRNSVLSKSAPCFWRRRPKTLHTPLAVGSLTRSATSKFPRAVP
jgi:hypothetical protein